LDCGCGEVWLYWLVDECGEGFWFVDFVVVLVVVVGGCDVLVYCVCLDLVFLLFVVGLWFGCGELEVIDGVVGSEVWVCDVCCCGVCLCCCVGFVEFDLFVVDGVE